MSPVYNEQQQELASQIDGNTSLKHWKDWTWQLKNSIRDIAMFEKLLNVEFSLDERKALKETIESYSFGGTLINNTQISGSIGNMNLWYKSGG